jgi:hemoglobin
MIRPSIYDAIGGAPALLGLAADFHARCLVDPVLEHPFSHTSNPEHIRRLADYWGEVFGGPPIYSRSYGGHSFMLGLHANQGAEIDLGERFVTVFDAAVRDAVDDLELCDVLHDYMVWATTEVMTYSPPDAIVPTGRAMPRWDWSGLRL